jgi:NAD-dependent deacetylase
MHLGEGSIHVMVLTGAGVSADSGVRTFRDAGGLWEGQRAEDVATPGAWQIDRARVWRFYQERRSLLPKVQPNAAHRALAELERLLASAGVEFTLATQNVDDLHERAGSRPLHMHGELAVLRCERCGWRVRDLESVDPNTFVPCGACAWESLRPDVVWFGEMPYQMEAIESAAERCTHFLAIGTSGLVWPAAGLLATARSLGARTWVQSLEAPENLHASDLFVQGRAAEVVPGLVAELYSSLGLPTLPPLAPPTLTAMPPPLTAPPEAPPGLEAPAP